jgi:hypothetical protein
MPIHEVNTPDGQIIKVEAPEGASERDILAFAAQNYQPKPPEPEQGDLVRGFKSYLPATQEVFGGAQTLLGVGAEKLLGEGDVSKYLIEHGAKNIAEANAAQQKISKPTDEFLNAWDKGIGTVITDWLPYQMGSGAANVLETIATSVGGAALGSAILPGAGSVGGGLTGLVSKQLIKKGIKEAAEVVLRERGKDAAEAFIEAEAKKVVSDEVKAIAESQAKKAIGSTAGMVGQAAVHGAGEVTSQAVQTAQEQGLTARDIDLGHVVPAAVIHAGADYLANKIGLNALDGLAAPTKNMLMNVTKNVLVTGAKEVPPEVLQSAMELYGSNLPLTDKKAIENYINTAAAAFGMSVLPGTVGGLRAKQQEELAPPPPQVEQVEETETKAPGTLMLGKPGEEFKQPDIHPMLLNPLGTLNQSQFNPEQIKNLNQLRADMGMPKLGQQFSIEDVAAVSPGKGVIESIVAAQTGYQGEKVTPSEVTKAAEEKNIDSSTVGFRDFLRRATGAEDLKSMSYPQRFAALKALNQVEAFNEKQILPPDISNATHYTPEQYNKAINGLKFGFEDVGGKPLGRQALLEEIKDFTNLKNDWDADRILRQAIRDGHIEQVDQKVKVNGEEKLVPAFKPAENVPPLPGGMDIRRQMFKQPDGTTAEQYVYYENDEPVAKFDDQYQAERYGITKQDDDILKRTVESAPYQRGLLAKRYGVLAEQELASRANPEINKGITTKQGLEGSAQRLWDMSGIGYNPDVKGKLSKIRSVLLPAMKKFGLEGVGLRLAHSIDDGKADGAYSQNLITIALTAENPLGVLRHETIHALKAMGAFTDAEWKILSKKAQDQWINQFYSPEMQQLYKNQYLAENGNMEGFDQYMQEEAIAEAFRYYTQTKPPAGFIANLMHRLNNLFAAIARAFRGEGFTSPEDIFQKIEEGEYKPVSESASNRKFSLNENKYKLDVEREQRKLAKKVNLTEVEMERVLADASRLNLTEEQTNLIVKNIKETKKRFPASLGWSALTAIGIEQKLDDKGNPIPGTEKPKYQATPYGYAAPPGAKKAPSKVDQEWLNKVAGQFSKLIIGIYRRAKAGDETAKKIIAHQSWYKGVAQKLRSEYGSFGDLLSDLLGATSPNTPVDTNFRFSMDVMKRFVRGDFDEEMKKFDKYLANNGQVSKYPAQDKIRQISGKLYGMNSTNAMLALADMWRAIVPGQAPKARNFALNLIGQSNMATIDVWAARMLRRAADAASKGSFKRIPPPAEQGVSGQWNANATAVTGEFGFGAAVLDKVSQDLKKKGFNVSPPDLQAIAWFAEKELWTKKNWTSVLGEGGSFEENLEHSPVDRYIAGHSVQQGDVAPGIEAVYSAKSQIIDILGLDKSVIAFKSKETKGLYGNTVENSFDTEWVAEKGKFDPSPIISILANTSKKENQYDFFISRALAPNEESENARPGAEVYFRTEQDFNAVLPILKRFTDKGQDGFTLAVDPRSKDQANAFIGVRLQYSPEISMRWDEGLRDQLTNPEELKKVLEEKRDLLAEIVAEVAQQPNVAHAALVDYDTIVIGKENYNEYIGAKHQGFNQAVGSKAWFGQPVSEHVKAAVGRYRGENKPSGQVVSSSGKSTKYSLKAPATPAFKQWFGKSKITNPDGSPKVMYHGTARDITEFRPQQAGAIFVTDSPRFAEGFASGSENYMVRELFNGMSEKQKVDVLRKSLALAKQKGTLSKNEEKEVRDFIKNSPNEIFQLQPAAVDEEMREVLTAMLPSHGNVMPVYVRAENPFDYENPKHVSALDISPSDKEDIAFGDWGTIEDRKTQEAIKNAGFDSFYIKEGGYKNLAVYDPNQIKSAIGNTGAFSRESKDIRYSYANKPLITKLGKQQTAGQQISAVGEAIINGYKSSDFWEKARIAFIDPSSGLSKRLATLPQFNMNGTLRADMLNHAKAQAINLIKNGLLSGHIVVNSDGSLVVKESKANLARTMVLADALDKHPNVLARKPNGQTISGRQYMAEIARILRGEEIIAEDIQKRKTDPKHKNRELQVTPEAIAWAHQQLAQVPQVNEILNIWREVNESLINLSESVGNISKEQADQFRKNKSYVPLYKSREDLGDSIFHALGKSAKSVEKGYELKGALDERNIWENLDKHYAATVAAAYENQTKKVAIEQLMSLGSGFAELAKNPNDVRINLRYKENGKIIGAIVENPNDVAAFQMMSYELNPIMKIASGLTKTLRIGALLNPMFWLKQLVRDPLHAAIVTNTTVTPFHAARGFIEVLRNNSEEAKILARHGVIGQYDSTQSMQQFLNEVGKEKASPSKMQAMFHKLMQIHEASDAATRVEIFKKARAAGLKQNMTPEQAINYGVFKARESINFSVHGNSNTLNQLRHMIPFFSAAITSLDTVYRAATGYGLSGKEKQEAQAQFKRRAMMMVTLATVYAMMLQGDEDYEEIPDYVKDNNWLIPSPTDKGFIKVAVPFEVGFLFKTIPEVAVRYLFGSATGKEVIASYKSGLIQNLPGGGIILSQATKPLIEAVSNHSFFTGNPIEGMSDQALPVAKRGARASETAKMLSAMGLDSLNLSPAKIDHLIQGYFAELGTFSTGMMDSVIYAAEGKEPPAKNFEQMQVMKPFLTDPNMSKAVSDFYKIEHSARETVSAFNDMKKKGLLKDAQEYMEDVENRKQMAVEPSLRKVMEGMTKIRAQINYYKENGAGLTAEQRRDEINKLTQYYNQYAQQGVKLAQSAGLR